MQTNSSIKKWSLSLALLLAAILSVTPFIDQRAAADYEQLFQRAFITFALARTINGVISVVQGTEVALQPAGVGVTLTPGEILDPVNDLVERFSWIMMGATISLGVQNVLLDISAWWAIQALVTVLAVWLLIRLWYPGQDSQVYRALLKRAFLLLLFIRFAVPVMLIANDMLYQQFLAPRYQQSTEINVEPFDDFPGPGDVATNGNGMAFVSAPSSISCNDVFGNAGNNYSGIADPTGADGNISLDPLFCNAGTGNFSLTTDSPCSSANRTGPFWPLSSSGWPASAGARCNAN